MRRVTGATGARARVAALVAIVGVGCSGGDAPTRPSAPAPVHQVIQGVTYTATTMEMRSFPVQLATHVKLENSGAEAVDVVFPDSCVVLLRVYRNASRTGAPAWTQERSIGCAAALIEVTLAPGGERTFSAPVVSARDILGDSLPNGRYYLSAVLRPNLQQLVLDAGAAELAQ